MFSWLARVRPAASIASRLSEDRACNVGLLEAGGLANGSGYRRPLEMAGLQGRDYDWNYRTVPQPFTANRVHAWPRGRILGGSSCINAMAHVRGHPETSTAGPKLPASAGPTKACCRGLCVPRIFPGSQLEAGAVTAADGLSARRRSQPRGARLHGGWQCLGVPRAWRSQQRRTCGHRAQFAQHQEWPPGHCRRCLSDARRARPAQSHIAAAIRG